MRTVLLASLRVHARRYLAAVAAVVVAVGFVVVTDALGSATRDGLTRGVALPFGGAQEVVTGLDGEQAVALADRAAREGEAPSVLGFTRVPVHRAGAADTDVTVGPVSNERGQRWQTLLEGRFPRVAGEALVDANAAKNGRVAVGDRLRLGHGDAATEVTVVGLADTPAGGVGSQLYLTWADQRAFVSGSYVESVAFADPPADLAEQVADISPDAQVVSARAYVEQRQQDATNGVDVISMVLLLFASIATVVAVIVIANTFSILFAQRQREVALLRCVGATRRQVRRGVRLEALAVGLGSSCLGLLVGAAAGLGLVAAIRAWAPGAGLGAASLSPAWLAGAFVLGTDVALVASWLPTRAVTRVSPLAALRPEAPGAEGAPLSRGRLALGLGVTVLGLAGLWLATVSQQVLVMLAAGTACFAGVLVLGPVLVPAVLRVVAVPLRRLGGPAGRLAVGNAVRHPRRTATTAASLLVGVTLTTAVLTGMATSRSAVDLEMVTQHPLDATLTATARPVGDDVVTQASTAPGVERAVAVSGAVAGIRGLPGVKQLTLLAPTSVEREVARSSGGGGALALPPGTIALLSDVVEVAGRVPERVGVSVDGRTERLRVAVLGEGWGDAALVAPGTLAALDPDPDPAAYAVWVRADDGTDPEDLAGDLGAIAAPAGLGLSDGLSQRAYVDTQLNVVVGAVVGLLGVSVAIALVGIANTLGLSVVERGREHALLRALGLTRRQLRWTLTWESLLLTVVAAVLGTAIGLAFAWVGVQTMVAQLVDGTGFVLPWGQLGLVLLTAALAGLGAGVLPARRAARVAPAEGLALD